jgi:RecB family exonuclease
MNLSVSRVKTFESCQLKYKYSYIDKLPKKDWEHLKLGKFVHHVLELFHKKYLEKSQESFNKIMQECFLNGVEEYKPSDEMRKECKDLILSYLKQVYKDKSWQDKVVAVEKSFDIKINDNVSIIGFIDRLEFEDGVFHVLDYKTTKDKRYLKNDFFQLLTYAYSLYQEDNSIKKVKGSYILIRHNFEYITTEFDVSEILKIKDKFEEYYKNIAEEKLYRPNITRLCGYCDYAEVCEDYKNSMKKDVKYGESSW